MNTTTFNNISKQRIHTSQGENTTSSNSNTNFISINNNNNNNNNSNNLLLIDDFGNINSGISNTNQANSEQL